MDLRVAEAAATVTLSYCTRYLSRRSEPMTDQAWLSQRRSVKKTPSSVLSAAVVTTLVRVAVVLAMLAGVGANTR